MLTSLSYFFFTFTTHNGCGCEEEADEKGKYSGRHVRIYHT